MTHFFTMDSEKLATVATAAGVTVERAAEFCTDSDWIQGDEHQEWLDTAPVDEIAGWLRGCGAGWLDSDELAG